MKFLCDRCKTRYSIGDDRVRGKILKIRCKNCANVITVREGMTDAEAGPEPAAAGVRRTSKPTTLAPQPMAAPPPVANGAKPPAALEEEWYVSIDGEQEGPFSLAEAQRWIGSKPFGADLHCWSEGFDDWLPVDKVSHFRGLRKKPAAPVAPPAPPPRVPAFVPQPQLVEEEPKPLFAATMAAIEKSAAAATPAPVITRTTPLGGLPSLPKVSNGSGAMPSIARPIGTIPSALPLAPPTPIAVKPSTGTGPRPALPLPAFDSSEPHDVATQIEARPFVEEPVMPKPQPRMSTLPSPFAASSTGPAAALPFAQPKPPTPVPTFPEPEPEGDMEIGEVSRVVNLADLARTATARKNGAPARLRTTGANGALSDPIAAMVAMPDAGYAPSGAMVPEQSAPTNNKKLYFLLGGVVLVLLVIVGVVVYVVSQNGDDDATALAHGRSIDLSRPDDPQQHGGTGPIEEHPKETGSNTPLVPRPNRPHVPLVPTGSNNKATPQTPDEPPSSNTLKPDEVEAMARAQSEATNRCYMRAQRGADAITIGDVKRINVTLTIDREGAVQSVDLSDHATDSLGKCLLSRIKGWRFHPSGNGLTTRLTLVFSAS